MHLFTHNCEFQWEEWSYKSLYQLCDPEVLDWILNSVRTAVNLLPETQNDNATESRD